MPQYPFKQFSLDNILLIIAAMAYRMANRNVYNTHVMKL